MRKEEGHKSSGQPRFCGLVCVPVPKINNQLVPSLGRALIESREVQLRLRGLNTHDLCSLGALRADILVHYDCALESYNMKVCR